MDAFVGEIMAFGGNYAPVNWARCQGQILSINQYQLLYSLIGTTYGGDGRTTFGVPNMAGSIPIGMGQGTGLTNHVLGQSSGVPTVTVQSANIPTHTHLILVDNSKQPGQANPTNAYLTATVSASPSSGYVAAAGAGSPVAMAGNSMGPGGGSPSPVALSNFMPTMGVTQMICVQGLFPNRP